jgi:hypothetical protein
VWEKGKGPLEYATLDMVVLGSATAQNFNKETKTPNNITQLKCILDTVKGHSEEFWQALLWPWWFPRCHGKKDVEGPTALCNDNHV